MTADEMARRNLATHVRNAVIEGAGRAAAVAGVSVADVAAGRTDMARGNIITALTEAATAASAVVLASDLRAPDEPGTIHRMEVANYAEQREHGLRVSPNRQGWRARLANIERLLALAVSNAENGITDQEWAEADSDVMEALAEVRALIDGEPS